MPLNLSGIFNSFERAQQVLAQDSSAQTEEQKALTLKGPSQKQGPTLGISTTYLTFGDVPVFTPRTQLVTFTNNGDRALRVTNIGSSNYVFASSHTSFTIPPGESRTLRVTFTPTLEQSYTAFISFQTNDSNYEWGSIYMTGRGVQY